jgi:hypothetical protein
MEKMLNIVIFGDLKGIFLNTLTLARFVVKFFTVLTKSGSKTSIYIKFQFSSGTPIYLSCLYQFLRLQSFMCRVSVDVEKRSSLGYTVSHEKTGFDQSC